MYERSGALEVAIPRNPNAAPDSLDDTTIDANLIFRVRILALSDREIVVEQPCALGQTLRIDEGVSLVGVMVIGQNRWMFRTQVLGHTSAAAPGQRPMPAIRLRMPEHVERCQRRNFYRVSTLGLNLPHVECYNLLDADSALMAQSACRLEIAELQDSDITGRPPARERVSVLPTVGPGFTGTLINIGGGGVGLVIPGEGRPSLDAERLYWLRINLSPSIPAPLAVTARLKHTHIDSSQRLYAGLAFEFGGDHLHQKFVVDQLIRYVAGVQDAQRRKLAG